MGHKLQCLSDDVKTQTEISFVPPPCPQHANLNSSAQLRNLVWALSRNDVFTVHENRVQHWNPSLRILTPVLDLSGGAQTRQLPGGVGPTQVS